MNKKELIKKLKYWLKRRNGISLTNKQIEQIPDKEEMLKILRKNEDVVEFEWTIIVSFNPTAAIILSFDTRNEFSVL